MKTELPKDLQDKVDAGSGDYYNDNFSDEMSITDAYLAGASFLYSLLQKPVNEGWISVEDKLPENNEYVLVHSKSELITTVHYSEGKWLCIDGWNKLIEITHWMKINPPKS